MQLYKAQRNVILCASACLLYWYVGQISNAPVLLLLILKRKEKRKKINLRPLIYFMSFDSNLQILGAGVYFASVNITRTFRTWRKWRRGTRTNRFFDRGSSLEAETTEFILFHHK